MEVDETTCGPLCQHPSCWSANKRLARGLPHRSIPRRPPTPPDDGLPTQSVVNLLADYGPDPEDRYPHKHGGRPLHNQVPSEPGFRRHSRDSILKLKTPMVTPASLMQTSSVLTVQMNNEVAEQPPVSPKINRVEVQEVFDLEDLRSEWQKTFMARQYYVWVPNSKEPSKQKQHPETSKSMPTGHLVDSSGSVVPRDVTELMVPRQLEWERCNTKVQFYQEDMYQPRIPQKRLRSPKTPQQGHPYSRNSHSSKSPRDNYYGIYELLDLPKDVLLKVLDHIDRRDLMDRERLAEALARAFPRLEHESSSLSMAYGDVLRQRKMLLQDLSSKAGRGGLMEPIPTKQVHLTQDFGRSTQGRRFQDLKLAPSPPPVQMPATPTASPVPRPQAPAGPDPREGQPQYREGAEVRRDLLKKPPLPAIPAMTKDEFFPERPKAVSISLGLPELPSGVKVTKPFMYKNKNIDLTLGPVASPPPQPATPPRQPKVHQPEPPIHPVRHVESPQSSDRGSSTIHVTMPTIATEIPEMPFTASDMKRKDTSLSPDSGSISIDTPQTPLHAVSPSYSTHVPKTPAVTPAMRLTNPPSQNGSPVATAKSFRQAYGSPMADPPGITPEVTGMLDTIQEHEHDEQEDPEMYRSKSDLPKSRRSVRFAPDMPPQPPSSPDESERSHPPLEPKGRFVLGAESTINNYSGASHTAELLTLQGPGPKEFPSSMESKESSQAAKLSSTTPNDPTPEPWPQVDEEAYNRTPSPGPTAALTMSSLCGDPSMAVQYDTKSEPSGLTSLLPSRESSFQSTKKSIMRDNVAESPGPPPPSPEPKQGLLPKGSSLAENSNSKLVESSVNLDDLDTDSEITISAKPPSNLDDISRIQTPATPLNSENHRENSSLAKPFLPTIFSEEASSQSTQHELADGESSAAEQSGTEVPVHSEEISKAPAENPHSLPDIPENPEPEQMLMNPPEITIIPGTRPASQQEEESVVVPEDKVEELSEVTHAATPQIPAYPQVVDEDGSLHGDGHDLQQKMAQLDHFDTTEDMFKEELQEELDRLSSESKKNHDNAGQSVVDTATSQPQTDDKNTELDGNICEPEAVRKMQEVCLTANSQDQVQESDQVAEQQNYPASDDQPSTADLTDGEPSTESQINHQEAELGTSDGNTQEEVEPPTEQNEGASEDGPP